MTTAALGDVQRNCDHEPPPGSALLDAAMMLMTGAVGAITGGNSLINVPLIDHHRDAARDRRWRPTCSRSSS